MGRKASSPPAKDEDAAPESVGPTPQETQQAVGQAVVSVLQKVAKEDREKLNKEGAEELRARLAKSQEVARKILRSLKLERQYADQLAAALEKAGLAVPPRRWPQASGLPSRRFAAS